jgi:hypothetical protein
MVIPLIAANALARWNSVAASFMAIESRIAMERTPCVIAVAVSKTSEKKTWSTPRVEAIAMSRVGPR